MTLTHGSRAESRNSRQSTGSRDFSTAVGQSSTSLDEPRTRARGLRNPAVAPAPNRRFQHKTGSQQVISVRGRRVVAPRADVRVIRLFVLVILLLCAGVGVTMWLSGFSTKQTFDIQELKAQEINLSNQIESLNRDVEDARSAAALAAQATELGMQSPVQPGVLAVQDNGEIIEQRVATEESRSIIDINGQQVRSNRPSSDPAETSEVSSNLQIIPQDTASPPYQSQTVPYPATTRESSTQAGGVSQ